MQQESQIRQYSSHPQAVKSLSRRAYLRTYQKTWVANRRSAWVQAHGPCCKCGSDDRLEVDHIDPKKKKIHPRALWSMSPKNPRRIAELAKCQVLCHGCHKEKTRPFLSEKARREHLTRPPLPRDSSGKFMPSLRVYRGIYGTKTQQPAVTRMGQGTDSIADADCSIGPLDQVVDLSVRGIA